MIATASSARFASTEQGPRDAPAGARTRIGRTDCCARGWNGFLLTELVLGAAGACTDGPKRCVRSCRAWLEPAEPEAARCTGDCDRATRCFPPGRYRAAIRACRAFLRWAAGSCLCRPLSGADRWVGPGRCVATVRVELIKPAGSPPTVLITWPAAPSVNNTDPRGLASIAAALVRVLAEAQARLAKINTKGRRS